jgi:hypothetical protein
LSSFKKYGLVEHVPPKHKNLGQKREMAKKQLENIVTDFPQMSTRKAASSVGVSPAPVYQIFTGYLHLKSLKAHLWYKLEDRNYEKKNEFLSSVS